MKRLLSTCMAVFILLIISLPTLALSKTGLQNFQIINEYQEGLFEDVSLYSWYAENVKVAYGLGLVKGTSPTTYNPNGNVTIAEAITLAVRLHDIYNGGDGIFPQGTVWYQIYVDYAINHKIITRSQFEDYTAIATRAQFATIFANALPEEALPAINEIPFIHDVSKAFPFANEVYALYEAGILAGSDSIGTFNANSTITRAEVATIVSRMALPEIRKAITLGEAVLKVDKTNLSISEATPVNVTVAGINRCTVAYRLDTENYVKIYEGRQNGNNYLFTIVPLANGKTTMTVYVKEHPDVSVDIQINSTMSDYLTVSHTNLTISDKTKVNISTSRNTNVVWHCDSNIATLQWGTQEGDYLPLYITPLKNGTATIRVYLGDAPHISQTITLTIKAISNNAIFADAKTLNNMATIGINEAYAVAKFPSTLHLNQITYSQKFVNGMGDLITRMAFRFYAANSMGGYGDIYVVVLASDQENTTTDMVWNGTHFKVSSYNSNPGMESYRFSNADAMSAYIANVKDAKAIPYD